jgi:hypothetical protein
MTLIVSSRRFVSPQASGRKPLLANEDESCRNGSFLSGHSAMANSGIGESAAVPCTDVRQVRPRSLMPSTYADKHEEPVRCSLEGFRNAGPERQSSRSASCPTKEKHRTLSDVAKAILVRASVTSAGNGVGQIRESQTLMNEVRQSFGCW